MASWKIMGSRSMSWTTTAVSGTFVQQKRRNHCKKGFSVSAKYHNICWLDATVFILFEHMVFWEVRYHFPWEKSSKYWVYSSPNLWWYATKSQLITINTWAAKCYIVAASCYSSRAYFNFAGNCDSLSIHICPWAGGHIQQVVEVM